MDMVGHPHDRPDGLATLVAEFTGRLAPGTGVAVDPDAELVRDLGYDSVTLLQLQLVLEDLFSLDPIPVDQALTVWTVDDLTELLRAQLGDGNGRFPEVALIDLMRAQHPRSGR